MSETVKLTVDSEVTANTEIISFTVQNQSGSNIYITSPVYLEEYDGENWISSSAQPPQTIVLTQPIVEKNGVYNGRINVNPTEMTSAISYRISIEYKTKSGTSTPLYSETFTISQQSAN